MPDGVWFAEAWRRCVHDPDSQRPLTRRPGRGVEPRLVKCGQERVRVDVTC